MPRVLQAGHPFAQEGFLGVFHCIRHPLEYMKTYHENRLTMRACVSPLVSLVMILAGVCHASRPIIQTSFTADPAPMVSDGVVYLYTGHDEDAAPPGQGRFLMREWLCYTSTDMVNWTDRGPVASLRNFHWADRSNSGWGGHENGAWAAHAIERNGRYYLYCTVQGRGIGVLVSDHPLGPFSDPIGRPLIGPERDSIDPAAFIDDDGQAYLYWGNPNLWYVKLNEDMISLSGEITKESSMAKVQGQADPFHFQEGPWVYKRDGRYYNAYASTCCPEGIGYATSDSPTGPWEFQGYIMRPDKRATGNHPGIIQYKGNSYVFGFSFILNLAITDQHHERRSVGVAELEYHPDGTIRELPWWAEADPVSQLGTLNPYVRVEGETIAWSEGIKSERADVGGMAVRPTRDGAYIKVQGVDFGKGATSFTTSVKGGAGDGAESAGSLRLHLGGLDGQLIGALPIPDTNGDWKLETIEVNGASGVQDLYLVFEKHAGGGSRLDCWQFSP